MEVVSEFFKIWVIVQHLWFAIRIMDKTEWLSRKLILLRYCILLWTIQKLSIKFILIRRFVRCLGRCLLIVI